MFLSAIFWFWLFQFALACTPVFLIVSFTLEMQNFLLSISGLFSSSLALTRILFVCSLFLVIMNIFPVCLCVIYLLMFVLFTSLSQFLLFCFGVK